MPHGTNAGHDEPVLWSGGAYAAPWFPIAIGMVGVAAFVAAFLTDAPAALLLVVGVVLPGLALWSRRTRLTVTASGVEASMNSRVPRRVVPISSITDAEAIDVRPLQWGGWGWRMTPKASALIVRRGDGVRLQLEKGRDLVVTVDDAATAARTINELRGR